MCDVTPVADSSAHVDGTQRRRAATARAASVRVGVRERHAPDRGGFNLLNDSFFHALKVYFFIRTVRVIRKTFRALLHQSFNNSFCTILLEKSKRDEKAHARVSHENPNPKNSERTTPRRGYSLEHAVVNILRHDDDRLLMTFVSRDM